MFGFNAEECVKKGNWKKLYSVLKKEDADKNVAIAKACAASTDDNAYNILVTLLSSSDRAVRLAAIENMGKQGKTTSITHLMHLAGSVGDDAEMKKVINTAMDALHKDEKE